MGVRNVFLFDPPPQKKNKKRVCLEVFMILCVRLYVDVGVRLYACVCVFVCVGVFEIERVRRYVLYAYLRAKWCEIA